MDRCSTELVTLIIEFACTGDAGRTARRVGLVSKYFRAISGRFEFREITVSGDKQLEGVLDRFRTLDAVAETPIDVRHLFISELSSEHALAAESYFTKRSRAGFWATQEGELAYIRYHMLIGSFWESASILIAKTSSTLRTICLLASNQLRECIPWHWRLCSKALGALSGTTFPCLVSLAVDHPLGLDIAARRYDQKDFMAPTTPLLRRLFIMSPLLDFFMYDTRGPVHPLLHSALLSANFELVDLSVCCVRLDDAENFMDLMFGRNWREEPSRWTLPGKLQSLELQCQPRDIPGGDVRYDEWAQDFVTAVNGLHIDGLVAYPPAPRISEVRECRYDQLLVTWKEWSLESP